MHRDILIIADIEGSTGCPDYDSSRFMTEGWARACVGMSLDVNAVACALFDAGARTVTVKDFHRTAYNILPELIDSRIRLVSGYKSGPVPGIGDPGNSTALLMLGMHAPSGSGGFLAHTLTSRMARIMANGEIVGEAELFSASLAPYGIAPVFLSGCPVACSYARKAIPGLSTFQITKDGNGCLTGDIDECRKALALSALSSLANNVSPFIMHGPFEVEVTLRDGEEAARKIATRWKLHHLGDTISFHATDFKCFYEQLIRICYLSPLTERILPAGLPLYDIAGRLGRAWARRRLEKIRLS